MSQANTVPSSSAPHEIPHGTRTIKAIQLLTYISPVRINQMGLTRVVLREFEQLLLNLVECMCDTSGTGAISDSDDTAGDSWQTGSSTNHTSSFTGSNAHSLTLVTTVITIATTPKRMSGASI